MEQNKDQSGAAVRGEAVAKCTVPPIGWRCTRIAGHEGPCAAYPIDEAAEKYEAEMLEVIDQRDKYHDMADQLAAQIAAMTEVDIGEHSSANEPWRNALIAGDEFIAAKFKAFCNGPVSARAADAPSEPSELGDWTIMQICAAFPGMARSNSMSEIIGFANAVRTFGMKSRAADALDSQPGTDEPTEREALIACLGDDAVTLLRANPDDEMAQTMREAAAMLENDGKALDSQPTGPVADVQARVRDAVAENLRGLYYCGRVWSAWSVGTMGEDDFSPAEEDDNIIANITDAVMAVLSPASSQPTEPWTRTEDRLPPVETPVFILHSDDVKIGEIRWENPSHEEPFEAFMYWDDPNDDGQSWDWLEVTHWMPIPPAPGSSQPTDGGVRNG